MSKTFIERGTFFRYLGVTLSCNLSWSRHISEICSKARKILDLFRHFYPYASTSTLISLYTSLVHPIIKYCSIIWYPTSAALCLSVESVQHFNTLLSNFHLNSARHLLTIFNLLIKFLPLHPGKNVLNSYLSLNSITTLFFFLPLFFSSPLPPVTPSAHMTQKTLFLVSLRKPLSRIISSHLQFFSGILSTFPQRNLLSFPFFLSSP